MDYRIVEMERGHIPQLCELEKECFSEPWSKEAFCEELESEQAHFLCAVDENNKLLGYIGVQEIAGEAYITNVAVFGAYRRCGIGKSLVSAAVSGADSRSCEFITLEVRAGNGAAIALYTSLGFEKAGERRNFYSRPTENAWLMTKFFVR